MGTGVRCHHATIGDQCRMCGSVVTHDKGSATGSWNVPCRQFFWLCSSSIECIRQQLSVYNELCSGGHDCSSRDLSICLQPSVTFWAGFELDASDFSDNAQSEWLFCAEVNVLCHDRVGYNVKYLTANAAQRQVPNCKRCDLGTTNIARRAHSEI